MRSTRKISHFLAAVAGTVIHVVLLGDLGTSAQEAGVLRRATY